MAKKTPDNGLPRYVRARLGGRQYGFHGMRRRREGEVFRLSARDKRLAKWMEPATEREFYEFQHGGPAPVAPLRTPQVDHQGRVHDQGAEPRPEADEPTGDQNVLD